MANRDLIEWKQQNPQKMMVTLATLADGNLDTAAKRETEWNKLLNIPNFMISKDGLRNVQTMLVDMGIAANVKSPFVDTPAGFQDLNAAELTAYTKNAGGSAGVFKDFLDGFLGAWFVLYRADEYLTTDGQMATSDKTFTVDSNGQVTVRKGTQPVHTYVNSFPEGGDIRECAKNHACSTIMFILSSDNRNSTVAADALTHINRDFSDTSKHHNAVVAAYAILRRLKWKGHINAAGKKQLFAIKDLPLRYRKEMKDDMVKIFTTADVDTQITDAEIIVDNDKWSAFVTAGAAINVGNDGHIVDFAAGAAPANGQFVRTPVAVLIIRCLEIVNGNDQILQAASTQKKQHFIKPMDPNEMSRTRILGIGQRANMGIPMGMGQLPSTMAVRMFGGQVGGGVAEGSSKLERQLENLVTQLNARGKELSTDTLRDFKRKLNELRDKEKDVEEFIEKFAKFNQHANESDMTVLSDVDMVNENKKYETASKSIVRKTLSIESALGNISFKVAGLDKIFNKDALVPGPAAPGDAEFGL